MKSLKDNTHAVIDISLIIMIGIAFAALMVIAYIIWKLKDQLLTGRSFTNANNLSNRQMNNSIGNVTAGFDSAVNLILIAVTIFILAIAIGALLMLRGR